MVISMRKHWWFFQKRCQFPCTSNFIRMILLKLSDHLSNCKFVVHLRLLVLLLEWVFGDFTKFVEWCFCWWSLNISWRRAILLNKRWRPITIKNERNNHFWWFWILRFLITSFIWFIKLPLVYFLFQVFGLPAV